MVKKPSRGSSRDARQLRLAAKNEVIFKEASAGHNELVHQLQVHQIELELQNAELREARAEAEANLQRYADLYDFAPIGYFTLDRAGVILRTNRAGAKLLGRSRSELVGLRFGIFVGDECRRVLADFLDRTFTIDAQQSCELTLAPADQPRRFAHIEARLDESGLACRATALDITERKRADDDLRIAASVYQSIDEAVVIVDAQNRIVAVNPAFTRLTGYEPDDALGRNPRFLKSRHHDSAFFYAMWQALLATGHWEGEITNRHKNGGDVPQWLSINTLYGDDGVVLRRIGLFSEINEEKRVSASVWKHATYDLVTGLPNRRLFQDRLQQEIDKMQRAGRALALLFIDLDRFKEVNDTLGHAVGDVLLAHAANRICACVRGTDTVARLGGDEFTVIMSDLVTAERVGLVAQTILETLAQPFPIDAETLYLSASIGITLYPADGVVMADLLKQADQAMYAAKNDGRNRFRYFTPEMQAKTMARLELIKELRVALASNQFEVYFQPIVNLTTGEAVKAEALLRWHHPTRGLVYPDAFIPVAEDSCLIAEIGEWVFQQSAAWVRRRQQDGSVPFQVSINKSPVQFLAGHTEQTWVDGLHQAGLAGESLVIEVTEGLLLSDRPAVLEKLSQFREAGIGLAIDDFGTGYSALAYLKKFNVDYLKIDRVFIRDLRSDPGDRALIEAIIAMAHKLGIQVIAEGVETVDQRDWLISAGCDFAQGYLYAPPTSDREIQW